MSEVAQILRAFGYLRLAQRCYSSRKVPDHYKTLGVESNASTKDIKAAFIKLSKESHPDAGNKDGHGDFVKISEAYNVLSKDRTRSAYDAERNVAKHRQRVHASRNQDPFEPHRAYQHRSDSQYEEWFSSRYNPNYRPFAPPPVDQRFRRVKSATIVLGCIIFSAIGFALQLLAIAKSPVFDREKLLEQSTTYLTQHKKIRDKVQAQSFGESVDTFLERVVEVADEDVLLDLAELEATSSEKT